MSKVEQKKVKEVWILGDEIFTARGRKGAYERITENDYKISIYHPKSKVLDVSLTSSDEDLANQLNDMAGSSTTKLFSQVSGEFERRE